MVSIRSLWTPIALMALCVEALHSNAPLRDARCLTNSGMHDSLCVDNLSIANTSVIVDPTTVPVTHVDDITKSRYVIVTITSTETNIVSTCITEYKTTTVQCTVSLTKTDVATVTNTETTTNTVPATVTTYTTRTIISTTIDPCPTTCSLSVETVNLYFWPTNRPYSYPSTYVDTALDYTFTSPSVYMLIPTAQGTNSHGPAGPSTTNWMLELDLEEVSTIVDGTLTRQLTLNDLGTDCPGSAEPSAIATMVDSRCDPILAAPKQVSSWAYPCNACGRFGLFDPPYAVPTLTGGLIETKTSALPASTSTDPLGVLVIVTYVNGEAVATATIKTDDVSGTLTSTVAISSSSTTPEISTVEPTSSSKVLTSAPSTVETTSSPTVVTASATRVTHAMGWLVALSIGLLLGI